MFRAFNRSRYQVSIYRTIGPLVLILVVSHFSFEGGTLVLIASVPGHCLSFTFTIYGPPQLCDPDTLNKFSFHISEEPQHKKWLCSAWRFQKRIFRVKLHTL